MEFEILGRTALRVAGSSIDLGSAKARGLLALLLYEVGNQVPVDRIIGTLWPGLSPETARKRLYETASRLRKALVAAGLAKKDLLREGKHFRLNVDPDLVDYHRFRRLSAQAGSALSGGDPTTALTLVRSALELWRGTPLDDLEGTWVEQCRIQMSDFDLRPAQYLLLEALSELRDFSAVLSEASRLTQEYETSEPVALRLMQGLDAVGDHAQALTIYEHFSKRVLEVVGSEPGPEIRALRREIIRKQAPVGEPRGWSGQHLPPQPPRQLPRPVPNFVGRADLIAELDELLASGEQRPGAVLHGMPCVGKTSLAVEWGNLRRDRFPDGQLFLDLRGYSSAEPLTPHDAMAALLSGLGVPHRDIPGSPDERLARLNRALDGRQMLLLLDNAQDTAQVRRLLAASARCFVLITSRDQLWSLVVREGVRSLHVPPLRRDESVRLLRAELRDARSSDLNGIRALADVSKDLPLGVKIVAQRAVQRPNTTLTELADELADVQGSDVLGAAARSDDDAGNLMDPFTWSYRALPATTALVFRALSLMPTTEFGPNAVAAVVEMAPHEIEVHLAYLARMNLLQEPGPRGRYEVHALLGQYASGLAELHDAPAARQDAIRRLLDWYLRTAEVASALASPDVPPLDPLPQPLSNVEPLVFPDGAHAQSWFRRERANLVAAVRLASRKDLHEHVWRLANYAHDTMDAVGAYEELRLIDQLALRSARAVGSPVAECGTLNNLGYVEYRLNAFDEARARLESALELATRIGSNDVQIAALHNLASLSLDRAEYNEALRLFEQLLALARRLELRNHEATILHQIGKTYQHMERDDTALEHYQASLAVREDIGHVRGQGTTLTALAILHRERGEPELARDCAEDALVAHRKSGDVTRTFTALVTLAAVYLDLGQFADSVERAAEAVRLSREVPALPRLELARALHVLGYAESALGEQARAAVHWQDALEVLPAVDDDVTQNLRDQLLGYLQTFNGIPQQHSHEPQHNTPDVTALNSFE